jgi:YgiT-type zinc finger domain-containing protein
MLLMTDLTLEELRGMLPEQDMAAKLREDAFLIRGHCTNSAKPDSESEPKKKRYLLALAFWFLRLSLRGS